MTKKAIKPDVNLIIETSTPTLDTQTTTVSFTTQGILQNSDFPNGEERQEDIDGKITITTRTYDAGSAPITVPTGAIALTDLMQ